MGQAALKRGAPSERNAAAHQAASRAVPRRLMDRALRGDSLPVGSRSWPNRWIPCKTAGQGRAEPPAFRFSGAFAASLHVAGRGLMGQLAAETMAGCRLTWSHACRRWLPVWLPKLVSTANVYRADGAAAQCEALAPTSAADDARLTAAQVRA
jgi:hypothetical protein